MAHARVTEHGVPPRTKAGKPMEPYGLAVPRDEGSTLALKFIGGMPNGDLPGCLPRKPEFTYVREWRFDLSRLWKFDFAWPMLKVAVEIEGGTFGGGRHTRGAAYQADCRKYNAAQQQGWVVLRYTTNDLVKKNILSTVGQVESVLLDRFNSIRRNPIA